jgi:hypothetical protein
VKFLRTLSTTRLIVLVVAVVVVAAGGAAIAVAARNEGPTPPLKPLDQAIHDSLAAPQPDGITARITFTNNLFPSGALLGNVGSALMSGASGRLWVTNDGQGRIELQSDGGDAQIGWTKDAVTIYDASSNTVYRLTLPADSQAASKDTGAPPTLSEISTFLSELGMHATISDAQPTNVAGQPAYSVTLSPKHDGGLLASAELAWDAARGVPLSVAIFAQGHSAPALELRATDIAYGSVSPSDVAVTPPADAKVVDLGGSQAHAGTNSQPAVTGLAAVQAQAGFPVSAPDTLVGLPRRDVRLVGGDTVVVSYGEGLGGLVAIERKADPSGSNGIPGALPSISLDGVTAHELATQLGTAIAWQQGGTAFVLAGSLPPAAAEAAARALR